MSKDSRVNAYLESAYGDAGPVSTGFSYRTELMTEPIERVLFEIRSGDGDVMLRLFFEKDQFAVLADFLVAIAEDYGCYADGVSSEEPPQ